MLLAALLGLSASPAMARENYALLIGDSPYPNLDQKYRLNGPTNDLRLVQPYLTTAAPAPFAPQDVIVLAAIRPAFSDLSAKVPPGDC